MVILVCWMLGCCKTRGTGLYLYSINNEGTVDGEVSDDVGQNKLPQYRFQYISNFHDQKNMYMLQVLVRMRFLIVH